jgi:hypothetical protein
LGYRVALSAGLDYPLGQSPMTVGPFIEFGLGQYLHFREETTIGTAPTSATTDSIQFLQGGLTEHVNADETVVFMNY